jgi:hypothetical protein
LVLRTWRDRWDWLRGGLERHVLPVLPALLLMTLVAFQEFELAALLKAVSWTDWLFVAQVTGWSLSASLQAAIVPAAVQLLLLLIAWRALPAATSTGPTWVTQLTGPPRFRLGAAVALVLALLIVVLAPVAFVVQGMVAGLPQLFGQSARWAGLLLEMTTALAASLTAVTLAWWLAQPRTSVERAAAGGWWPIDRRWWAIPGLFGSLLVSLCVLALFHQPLLQPFAETPLRWVVGLTLVLLPRAVVWRAILSDNHDSRQHLARSLQLSNDPGVQRRGRQLLWTLREEPRWLAFVSLTYTAYLDLTTAYLLAPTSLPSGVVRLYNFMHFGRTAALSTETLLLLFTPLLLVALVWACWRRV